MRKIIVLIIFLLAVLPLPAGAADSSDPGEFAAESKDMLQSVVKQQEEALNLEDLEDFISQVDEEVSNYLPEISFSRLLESFQKGELSISPADFIKGTAKYFFREVTTNISLLGQLLIIAVVCSILINLQAAFESGNVAKLANYVCLLALITLALGSFILAVKTGLAAIDRMVTFMNLLLPVLLVLLTAMGGLTSAALLQPFLMLFLGFMGVLTQDVIFPLIYLTALLSIANNVSERFRVSRVADFFRQITKVGIGLVLTLFLGVITVEGVAGAVVDGISLRTAKYVTGAFVPVAGSMLADALDAVVGGTLLLKNAVGLTGVLVLGGIVIFPVLKILALAVIYRLASALLQPIGDTLIADTLEDMAKSLFLAFAAVASVAIMFFLTIVIMVGAANFTVMLR